MNSIIVPPGASPYSVYLESITKEIFGYDKRGWEARFLVLICLTTSTNIMMLISLASVVEQLLKRNGGSGIWFIKRVTTGFNGGLTTAPTSATAQQLIVANTKLCLVVGCVLQGLDFSVYFWLGWEAYINNHRWALLYQPVLRAILPFPVVFIGLGVAFGTVQAYVLLHTDKVRQITLARITNYAFISMSIFWTVFFTATVIASSWAGTVYTIANNDLTSWLQTQQASYTGSFSSEAASELYQRFSTYVGHRVLYARLAQTEYGSLPAFAAMIFVINLSVVFVNKAIGEQQLPPPTASALVTANAFGNEEIPLRPLERLKQLHLSLRMPDAYDVKEEVPRENDSDNEAHEREVPWPSRTIDAAEDSVTEAPTATRTTNLDVDRMRVAQILEINTTKLFLWVMSVLIATATIGCGAVTIFVTIVVGPDGPFWRRQWAFEIAMYSYCWILVVLASPLILLGLLVQLRARKLWKARQRSRLDIQKSVEVSFTA